MNVLNILWTINGVMQISGIHLQCSVLRCWAAVEEKTLRNGLSAFKVNTAGWMFVMHSGKLADGN